MDLLTFISKLIDSLAWPLATVALAILLRRQIALLLPFVRRVKAGPLEAEFEREIRELRTSVSVDAVASKNTKAKPVWQEEAEKLAQINPRSAILEAWRQIEATLIRTLQSRVTDLADKDVRSTREILRLLGEKGITTPEEVSMLNQMRFLRNQAGHVEAFQPTFDAAMNFVRLAGEMIGRVGNADNGV